MPLATLPDFSPRYYYSGFYGGEAGEFRKMVEALARATEADIAKGVIARVHDESHINRYWLENPPATVLSFAYMYPGSIRPRLSQPSHGFARLVHGFATLFHGFATLFHAWPFGLGFRV